MISDSYIIAMTQDKYVHDVLWLSDTAFLGINNNRTLFKVDLLLDAVVFSRSIL